MYSPATRKSSSTDWVRKGMRGRRPRIRTSGSWGAPNQVPPSPLVALEEAAGEEEAAEEVAGDTPVEEEVVEEVVVEEGSGGVGFFGDGRFATSAMNPPGPAEVAA